MEGLREYIIAKNAYEFQDMVTVLLKAMGYYISYISPKGRDGGIDIIAYTDPLGVNAPRIVVQIKHKPDVTIPAEDIRNLVGTMKRDSDIGIFVTSGRFSSTASNEACFAVKHT